MDIAKIRKKMQEKEKKPKKIPVPGPEKSPAEEKTAPQDIPVEASNEDRIEQAGPAADTETFDAEKEAIKSKKEVNRSDEEAENGHILELLTFSISKEEFAFRVPKVEEILRFQNITRVPTMPDYVLGITSLRGKIIPVIDLEMRLGIKNKSALIAVEHTEQAVTSEKTPNKKILIVAGPKGLIGAIIDRVEGVIKIPKNEVLPPPAHLTEAELKFIEGVVIFEKRFISMIRAEDTLKMDIS
jgi:purine-binding chemotaxis protein CheW